MTSIRRLLLLPAFALAAACGGSDRDEQPLDSGLRDDLALAASAQAMPPMYMSPMEMGYAQQGYQQPYGYYPTPVATRVPMATQPVYRAPVPVARAPQRAPAPAPEPIRNTKRD